MLVNIDSLIFVIFLSVNLVVGLAYGSNVKSLKEYAVGDRNFSTATIAATIIATWIGAGFFAYTLSKSYSDGLPFIIAVVGNGFMLFILGQFYGPRMAEFLGKNTVSESIGSIYGNKVRLISSIAAICLACSYTALQIKVLSTMMNWALGFDPFYATIASAVIVIVYSSFGGIRSVTFTDIIQFMTFSAFIPGIALTLWGLIGNHEQIITTVQNHNLLDTSQMFSWGWVIMLVWFTLPDLDPALFQRVLMSKNVIQMRNAFRIASIICMLIILMTSWIAILVLANNDKVDPENIMQFILDNYSYTGLKGFTMAGISAMVMSTVDSYINSASVLFTNDFCKSLKLRIKNELALTRFVAATIGSLALIISLSFDDFLNLTLLATNFYMPIVTAPLTLAIFGFRSTEKSALLGITAGFFTVIIWRNFFMDTGIDSVIPGLIANFITLIFSHYVLGQEGGWVGIKDKRFIIEIQENRKRRWKDFKKNLREFSFIEYLKNNAPLESYVYFYFGAYALFSSSALLYLVDAEYIIRNKDIADFIQHSNLIISSLLLTYPIWPSTFKKQLLISIGWTISIIYTLLASSIILLFINNFNQTQSFIFICNILVIAMLARWSFSLVMVILGASIGILITHYQLEIDITTSIDVMEFKLLYILVFLSAILIALIRPKQIAFDSIYKQNLHLADEIEIKELEMMKAIDLKHEFLRNVNHEIRTPLMVMNIALELESNWDRFSEDQRREYIGVLSRGSDRLMSMVTNILDFSHLTSDKLDIKIEKLDLAELLEERIRECKRMYLLDISETDLSAKLEQGVNIKGDRYYIGKLLDNLIINAMKYGKGTSIEIVLKSQKNGDESFAKLEVKDNGIGIPTDELISIFHPFVVSTKTRTMAGGRGMGLALCDRIVKVHKGKIMAYSDGIRGSVFTVTLPRHY